MAKMYTLDDKLLIGSPEIRIKDKLYPIDDRNKTVKKMLRICDEKSEERDFDMIDEIFKLAFSKKDFAEIEKLDLSFEAYNKLFEIVLAAATGQEPKEIEERFQRPQLEEKQE
ncbi:MAG: hypothetical protein IJ555_00510 [Ruminococcus sp.]|nr:hypothetical protein [Ruminococcus sp.]